MQGQRRLPGVTIQPLAKDSPVRRPADDATDDRIGFEEFVHATGDRILRAAVLLCGDHHLAEDLTQTTFAKVYAAWPSVSRADSPIAYTRKVLLRTFLSHRRLRRSAEWPVVDVPERAAHEPDHGTRLDLLAALRRLPPQDRAVLVLRYWEDLSVARTAELLGIREGTCRVRAVRALDRLRTHLPDLTHPDPDSHTEDKS
jgi:RNA polymerase sigma-70 factor (sigma-E family)